MDIIQSLQDKISSVPSKLNGFIAGILEGEEELLLDFLKTQLFEGKSSLGGNLSPLYSEDLKPGGYFNSAEAAQAYANWKASLSYPKSVQRNLDAPNLYIPVGTNAGRFHSELGVDIEYEQMLFRGVSAYAERIIAKYGSENFGLTDENMAKLIEDLIRPVLLQKLKEYING